MRCKSHLCWLCILAALINVVMTVVAAVPTIEYGPRSRTVILWQPAAFGVIANGTPPLTYQWRKDDTPIPGATNDQILLAHADFADAGRYSVVVANAEGTVNSGNVELTVNAPRVGDIDFSFATGGRINSLIRSFAFQPDGKVVIAGDFTTVHGAIRNRVARLNADGRTDLLFLDGLSGADMPVNALAVQEDGRILVAGAFKSFNGVRRINLARLYRNGGLDPSLQTTPTYTNGHINTLVLRPDGKILIAGVYTEPVTVCSIPCPWPPCCYSYDAERPLLATLNPDGSPDTSFQPLFLRTNGYVNAVAVQSDGKVLVGGSFALATGPPRLGLARLNADGTPDATFQTGVTGVVFAIAIQNDGKILAGGSFTSVFGTTRYQIARLNDDGTLDNTFQSPLAVADKIVYSISLPGDGTIFIGGNLTITNGGNRFGLARLRADGTPDDTFQDIFPTTFKTVQAVVAHRDGRVYSAGILPRTNGVSSYQLARFASNGALDGGFENGISGANSTVYSFALRPNGKVVMGGYFKEVNGFWRSNLAQLNIDGSLDRGFLEAGRAFSGDSPVWSVTMQPDGKILAGSPFGGIVRLDADGARDTSFGSSISNVRAIAVQNDGKVIVGGHFYLGNLNSCDQWSIARLLANGQRDTSFLNKCGSYDSYIEAVAVQSDGKVLYGGGFSTDGVGGFARRVLTRLNPDGTLDTGFNMRFVTSTFRYGIMSIVPQSDGKLLLGGDFYAQSQDYTRDAVNIARVNTDGSMDTTFLNGIRANSWVTEVAVQPDGKILIGGSFTNVNGVARQAIARLHPDGTLDSTFRGGALAIRSPSSTFALRAMALQDDGNIIIGGDISTLDKVPMSNICRLWGIDFVRPRIQTISLGSGNVQLAWDAMPHRNYRVQYKENLSASAWIDLAGDILYNSSTAAKTDTSLDPSSQRFYRIVLLP